MSVALSTFTGASAAGVSSSRLLDCMIDVTGHPHDTFACRNASKTTGVLLVGAVALGAAGLIARSNSS